VTWTSGLVVYAVIWWTVLFAVLPWGVRRAENPEPGHDPGAPHIPNLGKKFIWTTIVAGVVWGGFYVVNHYNLVTFR
jgi:predicted secreted protein